MGKSGAMVVWSVHFSALGLIERNVSMLRLMNIIFRVSAFLSILLMPAV